MEIAKIIYRLSCPEERLVYLRFRDLERLSVPLPSLSRST